MGDLAEHRVFGRGIVVGVLPGGRVKVRFFGAPDLPRTVLRGDVRPPSADPPVQSSLIQPPSTGKTPGIRVAKQRSAKAPRRTAVAKPAAEPPVVAASTVQGEGSAGRQRELQADAWQAVEAIRLGVVPARCVRDYTVGRDEALGSLDRLLAARRGLRVLWGDYGAGKTHMLELLQSQASAAGFVTCRVTVNPSETPPTHPQRLYREIVKSIRVPGGAGVGLASLLDALVESPDHRTPQGSEMSRFVSPYLAAVHSEREGAASVLLDYLTGELVDHGEISHALSQSGWRGPRPLALSDYRTFGRVYLHLLGVLASWSRDAGFSGLLLLMDEVEYVDSLSRNDRHLAQEVMDHFAAACVDREDLSFDPDRLYKGGHDVHRTLPLVFRPGQPLSVVFAATPFEDLQALLQRRFRNEGCHIPLQTLTQGDVIGMVGRIFKLYQVAFPAFRPGPRDLERLASDLKNAMREGESSTRALVRLTVMKCDHLRLAAAQEAHAAD